MIRKTRYIIIEVVTSIVVVVVEGLLIFVGRRSSSRYKIQEEDKHRLAKDDTVYIRRGLFCVFFESIVK